MHNNYYFLRQLSAEIKKHLPGFTLVSCFSQNKDELVIEFNDGNKSFFFKASLQPEFQCLTFPEIFHRARKNSVDLFSGLLMNKVTSVRQFSNERSFGIVLEQGNTLVFKMHGARANVLWFAGDFIQEIFRNNFTADKTLKLPSLDREIDWSYDHFTRESHDLPQLYFTFGKPVWSYLQAQKINHLNNENQWKLIQDTRRQLENPSYQLMANGDVISFSLLPSKDALITFQNPVAAINEFFIRKISSSAFQKEKLSLLSHVQGKIKQADAFLKKTLEKFTELEGDIHFQQWADLIMANLHVIISRQEKIEVENFYDNQKPVEIKLKKELSPQKNAELYYRKGKNQAIEVKILKESIARKEKEIHALTEWKNTILNALQLSDLKTISSTLTKNSPSKQDKKSLPYHEFEFNGFKIWVGKNAAANDTLTLKHSFKDDLWLHAKDVAGSHVLIKYQSGKPFPKDVIERAAQLAAHYSKRKNEALCPVAMTPKKYVRKRKGDPAGMVVVEREDVMMVEPRK